MALTLALVTSGGFAAMRSDLPSLSNSRPHKNTESPEAFAAALQKYRNSRVVLFTMTEQIDPAIYAYMFEPIVSTLRWGLVDLRSNLSMSSFAVINVVMRDTEMAVFSTQLLALRTGDMYVHVGPLGRHHIKWREMHKNGVYIVSYQTEPLSRCGREQRYVNERWDYSKSNVAVCADKLHPVRVRHVPVGALNTARVSYGDSPRKLVFMRGPWPMSISRVRCVAALVAQVGRANLSMVNSIWDDRHWAFHLHRANAIHVNLHKACNRTNVPMEPRVAKLVNAHVTILTEPSDFDGADYSDLPSVFMGPISNMGVVYGKILASSAKELEARAVHSYKMFSHRMSPAAIMHRAGVSELIERIVLHGNRAK